MFLLESGPWRLRSLNLAVTKSAGRLVSNASEHLHSDNTLPWLEELGIVFQWIAHPVKWQESSQVGLLEETLYS